LEKGKITITNAKEKGSNSTIYYTTYKQLEGSKKQCNNGKGEKFKLSYMLYYMHERLNGYG
jgi:hypothetical protein